MFASSIFSCCCVLLLHLAINYDCVCGCLKLTRKQPSSWHWKIWLIILVIWKLDMIIRVIMLLNTTKCSAILLSWVISVALVMIMAFNSLSKAFTGRIAFHFNGIYRLPFDCDLFYPEFLPSLFLHWWMDDGGILCTYFVGHIALNLWSLSTASLNKRRRHSALVPLPVKFITQPTVLVKKIALKNWC